MYYLPWGRVVEVWREVAQNLWFTGSLNQDALKTVGAMLNDANCDLSRIFNPFKGGKLNEASLYLLPTDRLRAQDPKGYRNCLNSSALLWWSEPARAEWGLVWFGLRWKENSCRRWDQEKGLTFRKWRNEERLEKLLFLDPDEINFHTFSQDQWNHLCCDIFPSIQIEIASINS